MAGSSNNRQQVFSRILLGAVVLVLAGGMLLYLVPSMPGTGDAASIDTVAKVGDESVTTDEVRQQLSEIEQRNQVPKQLESLYAQQILKQLIFQKEIEYEAKRLGIHVSDQERADRIRQFLPTAYNGDTFVGMDRYAAEVQGRFQMSVPVFEEQIRQGLLSGEIPQTSHRRHQRRPRGAAGRIPVPQRKGEARLRVDQAGRSGGQNQPG